MRTTPLCGLAAALLAVAARDGHAQASPSAPAAPNAAARTGSAGVEGVVTADSGGRPIADAHVTLREAARSVDTDARGTFRIVGLAPGAYTLVVQKVGFGAAEATLTLTAGAVLGADVELSSTVPRLAPVAVKGAPTAPPTATSTFADIEAGVRRVGATFIGRATLDSAHAAGRSLTNVLQTYARGVRMVQYSRTGAVLLSSGRGMPSMRRVPTADPSDPNSPKACYAQIVVDGVRIYAPDNNAVAVPDLARYNLDAIEGVAFYPGPATTPAVYGGTGASCGTLVIWSRR